MSKSEYSKYTDAEYFEDQEVDEPYCNDCGSNDIEIENHQCNACGSPDISRDTILDGKTCRICATEFEENDYKAMFSESEDAFICDDCFEEHVKPLTE